MYLSYSFFVFAVFPCMMMSTLTVLVFCLPPDSGEKIALGVTVLLAFSVFMLAIAEKMPETSESIPLIGETFVQYFLAIQLCYFAVCIFRLSIMYVSWCTTLIFRCLSHRSDGDHLCFGNYDSHSAQFFLSRANLNSCSSLGSNVSTKSLNRTLHATVFH